MTRRVKRLEYERETLQQNVYARYTRLTKLLPTGKSHRAAQINKRGGWDGKGKGGGRKPTTKIRGLVFWQKKVRRGLAWVWWKGVRGGWNNTGRYMIFSWFEGGMFCFSFPFFFLYFQGFSRIGEGFLQSGGGGWGVFFKCSSFTRLQRERVWGVGWGHCSSSFPRSTSGALFEGGGDACFV